MLHLYVTAHGNGHFIPVKSKVKPSRQNKAFNMPEFCIWKSHMKNGKIDDLSRIFDIMVLAWKMEAIYTGKMHINIMFVIAATILCYFLRVMGCVDDFGKGGEDMLPRKQLDKRSRSPYWPKVQRKKGPTPTDQSVETGNRKFVPSDFPDSVNV